MGHGARQQRVLERNENADAAGRGIDGAHEGDQEDHRISMGMGERQARGDHEGARRKQQPVLVGSGTDEAYPQCRQRRAQQCEGSDDADLESGEP